MSSELFIDEKTFIASINGAYCRRKSDALSEIAKNLMFPQHFGNNLDALEDCLTDLSWIGKNKVILIINDFDYFLKDESSDLKETFLEIFKDTEKEWETSETESKNFILVTN
ncbi:MAG: barstar family protein [Flavobacteriaceae bacterium]